MLNFWFSLLGGCACARKVARNKGAVKIKIYKEHF